ncbi:hypothetical protein P7C73_g1076, partial [Tremellales sp. Uapishka_1]
MESAQNEGSPGMGLAGSFMSIESSHQGNAFAGACEISNLNPSPLSNHTGPYISPVHLDMDASILSEPLYHDRSAGHQSLPDISTFPLQTGPSSPWRYMAAQPNVPAAVEFWPPGVNDQALLPWLSAYFDRLSPICPVLNRANIYEDMLLGRHKRDQDFGAMILSMCALVMIQSVYTSETSQLDDRIRKARGLMQHVARMRAAWDFGQDPTHETILTSFFLFGSLFSNTTGNAAHHQLRLAVDMSRQLGLDVLDVYPMRSKEEAEQRIRIYLTLVVTERASALMRRQTIGLRGHPWSITLSARQMNALFVEPASLGDLGSSELLGLIYLASMFDNMDEDVLTCWEGRCKKTDNICDLTDRRQIIGLARRLMNVRHGICTTSLTAINDAQKTDILVTQVWLLNRVWNLAKSHNLLQITSEHHILTPSFALALVAATAHFIRVMPAHTFEIHGMGIFEKLSDILASVKVAKSWVGDTGAGEYFSSKAYEAALEPCLTLWERLGTPVPTFTGHEDMEEIVKDALKQFRHGKHPYNPIDAD